MYTLYKVSGGKGWTKEFIFFSRIRTRLLALLRESTKIGGDMVALRILGNSSFSFSMNITITRWNFKPSLM